MPTLDWLNRAAAFDIAKNVPYRLLEAVSEHVSTSVRADENPSPASAEPAGRTFAPGAGVRVDVHKQQSLLALSEGVVIAQADGDSELNRHPHPNPLPPAGEGTEPAGATSALATHNNLLIQGDNLEALKALLPFYRGQVKCIFIDPPYNAKSAFVK